MMVTNLAAKPTRLGRAVTAACTPLLLLSLSASLHAQIKPNWKTEWEQVAGKARQEGKVIVWGSTGQQIRQAMIEGFSKAFPGISLEWTGARGSQHLPRLLSERNAGIYSVDILSSGVDGLSAAKRINAFDPIRPALILPEVLDMTKWRDQRLAFGDKGERYILIFVTAASPVAAYDPKQVKPDEIASLYDLLAPKWKGKLVVSDPIPSGASNSWFHWIWNVLGPEKATDFFQQLKGQAAVVSRDYRRDLEWVAQGRYPLQVSPSLSISQQLAGQGVQTGLLWDFKDHGTFLTASTGAVSLVNRAPHPNAAKVFINWLLTQDGQTRWSLALNAVSRRLDVPTDHLPQGVVPRAGVKYWNGYAEDTLERSEEEEKVLKDIFGR
jgi:iron(III) transport system substrate-binding protein